MRTRLKASTIELIRTDGILFGRIADTLKVLPTSMDVVLRRNRPRLTEFDVLQVISNHTGKKIDDLIEKENADVPVADAK